MSRKMLPPETPRLEADQRVTISGDVPPEYMGVEAIVLNCSGLRRSHSHPRSNPSILVMIPGRDDELLTVLRECLTPVVGTPDAVTP